MDRLRQVLNRIVAGLRTLTLAQRALVLTVALLMGMSLLLVAVWTGKSDMTELLPSGSAESQVQAAQFLKAHGIRHRLASDGKVLVPQEEFTGVMAQMAQDGPLPSDNVLTFNNLASKSPWTMSEEQRRQQERIAVQNELSRIIGQFHGVKRASVILDVPLASGIGGAVRKPTASATVFTASGKALDQDTVDAIANLIASSRSGLTSESVRVIDGSTNQQRKSRSDSSAIASGYLEHATKVEDRVRGKLLDMLAYIPGVIVAVNAQVDVRQTVRDTTKVLDPGKGTVTAPIRESTNTREDADQSTPAEPGVRSNVGLDINRAGGGGTKSTDSKTESEMKTEFGKTIERTVDPRGMPLKINATINIPRSYFAARWRAQQPGGGAAPGGANAPGPSEQDLAPLTAKEIERITADVKPQVDASIAAGAESGAAPGDVVVSMIPDMEGGGAGGGSLASAGGATAMGLPGGPMAKTVGLGALALTAVGMMLLMIRRSSKVDSMPTPEELGGLPPALNRSTDLVGEADEADNALAGIELSEEAIKTRKLKEQVEDVVKAKPAEAAQLLNRWISVHE